MHLARANPRAVDISNEFCEGGYWLFQPVNNVRRRRENCRNQTLVRQICTGTTSRDAVADSQRMIHRSVFSFHRWYKPYQDLYQNWSSHIDNLRVDLTS